MVSAPPRPRCLLARLEAAPAERRPRLGAADHLIMGHIYIYTH